MLRLLGSTIITTFVAAASMGFEPLPPPVPIYDVLIINTFPIDDNRLETRLIVCQGQTKRWFNIVDVIDEHHDTTIIKSKGIYFVSWKYAPGNEPMREYLIAVRNVYIANGFSITSRLAALEWNEELYRHREMIAPLKVHNQ